MQTQTDRGGGDIHARVRALARTTLSTQAKHCIKNVQVWSSYIPFGALADSR